MPIPPSLESERPPVRPRLPEEFFPSVIDDLLESLLRLISGQYAGARRKPFRYTPLADGEIRLFRLLPSDGINIACQMQHFQLSRAPCYTALSYRWGATTRPHSIYINEDGKKLGATKSLYQFLQVIRPRSTAVSPTDWRHGWLWADALCINQEDLHERSTQVSRMRKIFECAHTMAIWLGRSSVWDSSASAMALLRQIAKLDENKLFVRFAAQDNDLGMMYEIGDANHVHKAHIGILEDCSALFNMAYWNRAWVLQEASTPQESNADGGNNRTAWVCRGSLSISWRAFTKAHQHLGQLLNEDVSENLPLAVNYLAPHLQYMGVMRRLHSGAVRYIQELQSQRELGMRESLYVMLVKTRQASATDPRDKLYAILELSQERFELDLRPDYRQDVEEVYTRLARTFITRSRSLYCLGSAGLYRNPNIPSWVPDWSVPYVPTPFPFIRDGNSIKNGQLYNACGNLTPEISFRRKGRQLIARGLRFDHIKVVSQPRNMKEYVSAWKSWTQVTNPDASIYISGCSRLEAFGKTIRADVEDYLPSQETSRRPYIGDLTSLTENPFKKFNNAIENTSMGRLVYTTGKRYMGIAPSYTKPGDSICILFGSQIPVVLREWGDRWFFVGQTYVHGIMDGQAVQSLDVEKESQIFCIN